MGDRNPTSLVRRVKSAPHRTAAREVEHNGKKKNSTREEREQVGERLGIAVQHLFSFSGKIPQDTRPQWISTSGRRMQTQTRRVDIEIAIQMERKHVSKEVPQKFEVMRLGKHVSKDIVLRVTLPI